MSTMEVPNVGSRGAAAAPGVSKELGLSKQQRAALEGAGSQARSTAELFLERDEELAFPGVDADSFRRALSALCECNEQVAEAKAALAAQLAEHTRRNRQFESLARRGLAYARIYAEGDEELEAAVSKLELRRKPTAARRARVKKPRSATEPAKELPFQSAEVA